MYVLQVQEPRQATHLHLRLGVVVAMVTMAMGETVTEMVMEMVTEVNLRFLRALRLPAPMLSWTKNIDKCPTSDAIA